jgi:hypothetical protein
LYIDQSTICADNENMGDINTNYKTSTITVLLVLLAILAAATASVLYNLDAGRPDTHMQSAMAATPKVQGATIIHFTAEKGKTILAQLQERERVVVQQDAQYGSFVENINGIKNGTDNRYWACYINGQIPNIGAGSYVPKGGEEIVWKFE